MGGLPGLPACLLACLPAAHVRPAARSAGMDLYSRELYAPLGYMHRHPVNGKLTVKSPINLAVKLPGSLKVGSFLEARVLAWEAGGLGAAAANIAQARKKVRGRLRAAIHCELAWPRRVGAPAGLPAAAQPCTLLALGGESSLQLLDIFNTRSLPTVASSASTSR
jgi:hypothetical protein